MLEDLHKLPPYSLEKKRKHELLSKEVIAQTRFHYENCLKYRNIIDGFGVDLTRIQDYYNLPFLPVRLFKEMELLSIPKENVFKLMTSSGTTGQKVSKIYLDKETALAQQKVLIRLLSDFAGKDRKPMLVIDTSSVIKNRDLFTARGAALLSINLLGRDVQYALNDEMGIDYDVVDAFVEKYRGKPVLIFGFTFMIWQHLYRPLAACGRSIDLSNAILLQSGGWKKLQMQSVSREVFKKSLNETCGITRFSDHYGMAEQNGCVYIECEYGNYHTSIYSDIITRRYQDFSACEIGEKGIIQVISCLPHSYPGNSLLTEDEGTVLGEDDCPCGRKGKYIQIQGRISKAELRGCSDTYAAVF